MGGRRAQATSSTDQHESHHGGRWLQVAIALAVPFAEPISILVGGSAQCSRHTREAYSWSVSRKPLGEAGTAFCTVPRCQRHFIRCSATATPRDRGRCCLKTGLQLSGSSNHGFTTSCSVFASPVLAASLRARRDASEPSKR